MGRWLAIIAGILLAAAAGYLVAYVRFHPQSALTQHVESRLQETKSELSSAREETHQLQQRIEQLTKEQERLAQENEILRKQQTTEQLLTGKGGELPAQPLK
jgi:TolA-binding protein